MILQKTFHSPPKVIFSCKLIKPRNCFLKLPFKVSLQQNTLRPLRITHINTAYIIMIKTGQINIILLYIQINLSIIVCCKDRKKNSLLTESAHSCVNFTSKEKSKNMAVFKNRIFNFP